jgi:hypothetical protein
MRCSLLKIAETNVQAVQWLWLELCTLLLRLSALLLCLSATRDNASMHGDARGNTQKALPAQLTRTRTALHSPALSTSHGVISCY